MEKNFKAGDAVQLTTGGPIMTVDFKNKEGLISCRWHNDQGLQEGTFAPKLLREISRTRRIK